MIGMIVNVQKGSHRYCFLLKKLLSCQKCINLFCTKAFTIKDNGKRGALKGLRKKIEDKRKQKFRTSELV